MADNESPMVIDSVSIGRCESLDHFHLEISSTDMDSGATQTMAVAISWDQALNMMEKFAGEVANLYADRLLAGLPILDVSNANG